MSSGLPLKADIADAVGMSQMCQNQTFRHILTEQLEASIFSVS
jgi:hypothetical protein